MKREIEKIMTDADPKLMELGFKMIQSEDNGMSKSFEWTNNIFKTCLFYDRGYYNCEIETIGTNTESYDIIWLLRFLKNDITFLAQQLEEVNLYLTFPIKTYVDLISSEFSLIKTFIKNHGTQTKQEFNLFISNNVSKKY